jgi:septum formation protein
MIHIILNDKKIVLASQSPRRKHIMDMLGVSVLQIPSMVPEIASYKQPAKIVMKNAEDKALAVAKTLSSDTLVIGSDTIVCIKNDVLEKPSSTEEAKEFLRRLSGITHYVYSSVVIAYEGQIYRDYDKTKVEFKALTEEEIDEYVKTEEPMDKAGAYGIQGFGSQFIHKLHGDYFTVMGFPVSKFYELLKKEVFKTEV